MIRNTKGKAYKKYCYTLKDIADRKEVSIHSVRSAIKRGVLNPYDVVSVGRYVGLPKWGRGEPGVLRNRVEESVDYSVKMPTLKD